MDTHKPTATGQPERTIGQLVADASNEVSGLVRAEIALAKAEITADVSRAAVGAGLLGAAGYMAAMAFVLLCFAGAYGLTEAGLAEWAAFLIVTGVLLVIAAALALVGKGRLSKLAPPQRTIDTAKDSVAALKGDGPGTGT